MASILQSAELKITRIQNKKNKNSDNKYQKKMLILTFEQLEPGNVDAFIMI